MFTVTSKTYLLAVLIRQFTAQWWLPQVMRERLARAFFRPNRQQRYPFRVYVGGALYRGVFSEYLDWRIFFLGSFERETINLCKFLAAQARNRVFCDIGANKGLYSLVLARAYHEVFAFEPLAGNVRKFESALAENCISNVRIFPFAIGDRDEERTFFLPPSGNEGIGSFVEGHVPGGTGTQTIRIRRADDVFAENGICPGLIKIDTEGFEWQVLQGMKVTLETYRPFVVMEIGATSKDAIAQDGGLYASLPSGYRIFEVSDHTTVSQFFLRKVDDADILTREISNNLLAPVEKVAQLERFIR